MRHVFTAILILLVVKIAFVQNSEEEKIIDVDFEANQWNTDGHQLMSDGKYAQAKELFWKAITKDPKVMYYYENLANAYSASDDQEGLLKCYEVAKKTCRENQIFSITVGMYCKMLNSTLKRLPIITSKMWKAPVQTGKKQKSWGTLLLSNIKKKIADDFCQVDLTKIAIHLKGRCHKKSATRLRQRF